jgi:hypothetical protein
MHFPFKRHPKIKYIQEKLGCLCECFVQIRTSRACVAGHGASNIPLKIHHLRLFSKEGGEWMMTTGKNRLRGGGCPGL